MALDENFVIFLVTAVLVLFTSVVALPSPGRIERDPSTAFKGGKRALVNITVVVAIFMGLILVAVGGLGDLKPVTGSLTMVHVGGISLLVMAILLVAASVIIRRLVKRAGKGSHEEVIEVGSVTAAPRSGPVYRERYVEEYRDGYPERYSEYPPMRAPQDRRAPPPPRRAVPPPYGEQPYERRMPPPRNEAPPPRATPRRRPPVG
jgi:hypothetical protein